MDEKQPVRNDDDSQSDECDEVSDIFNPVDQESSETKMKTISRRNVDDDASSNRTDNTSGVVEDSLSSGECEADGESEVEERKQWLFAQDSQVSVTGMGFFRSLEGTRLKGTRPEYDPSDKECTLDCTPVVQLLCLFRFCTHSILFSVMQCYGCTK